MFEILNRCQNASFRRICSERNSHSNSNKNYTTPNLTGKHSLECKSLSLTDSGPEDNTAICATDYNVSKHMVIYARQPIHKP